MISVEDALSSLAEEDGQAPAAGWPEGAPARDFLRSPAAARVGRLARAQELFCFHFERRAALDLPDDWIVPGCESDAEEVAWQDGKLTERKYQSFRHDLLIGSFHPGHRGKWTTHELCHALVGFAWRSDASPLFHATAARLAELLPVLLYYFFDEVRLERCPDHAGAGALYRAYCPDCEAQASFRPLLPAVDRAHLEDGLRFLDRERAAIAQTRRTGRPIAHRFGSLDLCSDGLRYARAHRLRLGSRAFAIWTELFDGSRNGLVPDLDALEERVMKLTEVLLCGAAPGPWLVRPRASRDEWVRQDLAMRLLTVHEETDGEAATELLAIARGLAGDMPMAEARDRYDTVSETYVLPPPSTMWGLGYPVEGSPGCHAAQMEAGLHSAAPLTMRLFEGAGVDPREAFLAEDATVRAPLGERFADWLDATWPGPAAELARFEAAILAAGSDETAASLATDRPRPAELRLARGVVVVVAAGDPIALAEAVEEGSVTARVVDGHLVVDRDATPVGLIVGRNAQGELLLVAVDADVARALKAGDTAALPPQERISLVDLGVLVPTRWTMTTAEG